MPTVAEVVRRYGPAYLERFGDTMPAAHRKVLRAIAACRTGELGMVLYRCEDCGRMHAMGRSCGDRHCPSCQRDKAEAWLEKQTDRLLPCPYFLVTFTLPSELRDVARAISGWSTRRCSRPRARRCAPWRPIPKYIGTDRLGFFGVLHTWGRTLEYHPHVHYVVPGGGLSADGDRWLPSRADFLVPVKALSILFRAKFRDLLRARGLAGCGRPVGLASGTGWCTAQPAGDGRESLRYLAPYVFRVAIGDHRIVSCDDGRVTFTYRKVGSKRQRKMTLDATEFLRRYLQHVLPSGFPKVRHYGFLSPAAAVSLELVRWLIALWAGLTYVLRSGRAEGPAAATGRAERARSAAVRLVRLGFVPAAAPAVFDTS